MTDFPPQPPWAPLGDAGAHYWLVQKMAKTCGVDTAEAVRTGDLDQEQWAALVQRCRTCQWTEGCERWLARLDHPEAEVPPEGCVNSSILLGLAEGQRE